MSNTARAVRAALLEQARAEAAGLRVLCCLRPAEGEAGREALLGALGALGTLAVGTLEIRLLAPPDPTLHALARVAMARGELRFQTGPAPDAAPEGCDLLIVQDPDLQFGMDQLLYWLAGRGLLAWFQRRPAFLRRAWSASDGGFRASDIAERRDLAGQRAIVCGDWRFLPVTDAPGLRLIGPAAPAPHFDPVIPLLGEGLIPAPECCLAHRPSDGAAGGTALHRLFWRSDAPLGRGWLRPLLDRSDPPPEARGIGPARALAPAGRYRRAMPRLIDTTALDADARAASVRDLGRCDQAWEAPLVVALTDALVVGDGTVVTARGTIVEDSCWEYLAAGTPPELVRTADGGLRQSAGPERFIAGPALLLRRPYGRNWGHFLLDAALSLAWAEANGLAEGAGLIVGADDPPGGHDILARIRPGAVLLPRWAHENWRIGTLRYLTPVMATPLFRLPAAIAALRAALLPARSPGPGRRLFISRGAEPRRRLVNEDALFAVAAAMGFERIEPETLPFDAQMALFQDARAVIAVKGAALANLVFCRPETPVIVLSPAGWPDTLFWDLAAQLRCPYFEIFGPTETGTGPAPDRAFQVPPAALARALRVALPTPPPNLPASVVPPPAPQARVPALRPGGPQPAPSNPPAPPRAEAAGAFYQHVLARIHAALAPRRYLEIGTLHGETLALARCPAIAVDPAFQIDADIAARSPLLALFAMESDQFFATHDPVALLGGPIDLGFIDGLHHAEVALRDFINLERHAHPGGVIVLHDCLPLDVAMTRRDQHGAEAAGSARPAWWTGDVWRLLPALRRWRPDLEITVFDASPTGIAVIRGLDPTSEVLAERGPEVVAGMFAEDDAAGFARHVAPLRARPTEDLESLLDTVPHPGGTA